MKGPEPDRATSRPVAHTADVVVVGAGLAGVTAASILARSGTSVILIDRTSDHPASFKAEKIEADQAELLRRFGLFELVEPVLARISTVKTVRRDGRVTHVDLEQYGGYYHEIVNQLRRGLDEAVEVRIGRVVSLTTGPDRQSIGLEDGTTLSARLVVLATGPTGHLGERLGIGRKMISERHSLSFGFSIARSDGRPFSFESINYYCENDAERVAYLTLFAFPKNELRANLFTYWDPTEPAVRNLLEQPAPALERLFPRIASEIGAFDVVTRVRSGSVDLYQAVGHRRAGIVLIGDSFQRVCPSVGQGVSRALTDVDVLCHGYIPEWLASDGMGAEKIKMFYDDPRKRDADQVALSASLYAKDMALGSSLLKRLQRTQAWGGLVASVRQRRRLLRLAAWLYSYVRTLRGEVRRGLRWASTRSREDQP